MYNENELKWFDRWGVTRPTHISHDLKIEDIEEKLKKLKVTSWTLEGNLLKGSTEMGPFAQTIPTDVVLVGETEEGLPKFKKVVL